MQVDKLTLLLTTKETMHELIFTFVIFVIYALIADWAKKSGNKKMVCKWSNIISSFFAWFELVCGDFIQLFGTNDLKYALIFVAVVVLVNNMMLSE